MARQEDKTKNALRGLTRRRFTKLAGGTVAAATAMTGPWIIAARGEETIKLGGPTPLIAAAVLCDAIGLCVNLAMVVESTLGSAAMAHAACAVPQADWGVSLGSLLITDDPVVERLQCRGGEIACPAGPGLGVTVDEAHLRRLAPP